MINICNDKNLIPELFEKYHFFNNRDKKNECIIIGSAPTIASVNASSYISNTNKYVIRVNRLPLPDYIKNYSNRTDFIFTFSGTDSFSPDNHTVPSTFIKSCDIKRIYDDIKIFNPYMSYPTTGFLCILLAMYIFDDIELLGFGETGKKQDDSHMNITIHSNSQWKVDHDFNMEHAIIDNWITDTYKNKIYRLEESKLDLVIK